MVYLEIAIMLLLILLNGVFAMSELAIVSSKKVHLRRMASEGNGAAAMALAFAEDTGKFLPAVQVGITLIGILAGAFSGATLSYHFRDYLARLGFDAEVAEFISIAFIVLIVTYFSLVIGELVPKELALRKPEKFATFVAPLIHFVSRVAWPAVWFLNRSSALVLRLIRAGDKPASTVTQEEVEALIEEGAGHGVFARKEHEMLAGVMLLADKPVRTFMIPRDQIVCIDRDAAEEDVKAAIVDYGYSRFPVQAKGDEDHVLGIVQTKDILTGLLASKPFTLKPLIRQISVFPDTTSAVKVMESLRHAPTHVAIIVDKDGKFEGMVTLVDLVAAITGEFDEPGEEQKITRRPDGAWLIDGGILIDRAFKGIGLRGKAEADARTLADFIRHHLHAHPGEGDVFEYKNYSFEIVDMDDRRVDKVMVRKLPRSTA